MGLMAGMDLGLFFGRLTYHLTCKVCGEERRWVIILRRLDNDSLLGKRLTRGYGYRVRVGGLGFL